MGFQGMRGKKDTDKRAPMGFQAKASQILVLLFMQLQNKLCSETEGNSFYFFLFFFYIYIHIYLLLLFRPRDSVIF
ncbi:hypothetical protein PUN28_001776 [Cardiocondyla obscurior]|uniref:Uncharacterized protein n=1 Tax=Cardiocondyla obscurior TaxID=286306 RepID=A0AAW2GR38_9HYME